ncbi:MAG: hypothetical protein HQM09_06170 [Candidatus Riflebacteria bacterium]|nr:hypothetical protein [Candidatus Riflebacteria bacterium]
MKLKQIDLSDIRILIVGLVLLVIPVAFLAIVATRDVPGGFSRASVQDRLTVRKSVFNFAPPAATSGSGAPGSSKSGSSGGGSVVTGAISGVALSESISRELEVAMKNLENSPEPEIDIPGMQPDQKMALKADMNRNYRKGCAFLEQGDLAAGEKAFLSALNEAGENMFLQAYALAGLVEIFSRSGRKKEMDDTMGRFADAVAKLPGGIGGDLPLIMRETSKLLGQMKDQVDVSKLSEQASKIPPLPEGLSADPAQIKAAMAATLANIPIKPGGTTSPGGPISGGEQ